MGIRRTVAAAMIAAFALAVTPSYAAHSESGEYTIGTTPGLSLVCSPDCLGEPGLNIGGYTFAANGEIPVSVTIADATAANVPYTVCQDFNGALCGEANEPRVTGCGNTVDLSASLVDFTPAHATSVFIRIADQTPCPGPALGGAITMTFADVPA